MSTDKVAALGRTLLFKELDEASLRALATRAVERRFRKDELLFVAGEEARGLYVIVEGAVRAFRESADGREQVIHVERAGSSKAIGAISVAFTSNPSLSNSPLHSETDKGLTP